MRLLIREVAAGCVLYRTLRADPATNGVLCCLVCAALAVVTRKRPLVGRRDGFGLATGCVVISCGGLVFRSLVVGLSGLMAHSH